MIHYKNIVSLQLEINEHLYKVTLRPADTLLDVLREQFGLSGAKPGCENGDCGACTILMDGKPVKACLVLAIEMEGKKITTIEGVNNSKMQEAFLEESGFQCGYCTSGFLLNCHALVETHPNPEDSTIREWLQSNLCRCTGYKEIENAVKSVLLRK